MSRPSRLALAAAVVVLATGCALRGAEVPDPPARPLEATAGEQFEIELESNGTTGYRWYLDGKPDPNVVRVIASEYRPSGQPLAGAAGHEVWTFQAFAPGTDTLAFEYRSPWAGRDAEPARRVRYAVRVRGAR